MSSQLSWRIIKQLSGRNTFGFSFQDAVMEFPDKRPENLARVLSGMVQKGMLLRIARNIYHIIPLNADPKTYFPDPIQVAKYMMQNKEYYIGYASAMKIHGLTLKSGTREYVVTEKQIKPAIINIGGIAYQFIHHDTTRFYGFSSIWINQLEEAMVSDLERTIVDVATKPGFCGGIVEVGNAIFRAMARTDHDKLFYYFARNGNKSAKRRYLFLTDLLGLEWSKEHDRMMGEIGSGISLLDPSVPDQGSKRSKFGLKINVGPNCIRNKVYHQETR
jgi:predicted transcriptional regulator of viral defense system